MRKVYLLSGFQNWGKTHLIQELFGKASFWKTKTHEFHRVQFCVQPKSNDDLGKERYEIETVERIDALIDQNINPTHIFSAFCPTQEPWNQSVEIIRNIYGADEVHLIAIQWKWCKGASLEIPTIQALYGANRNVSVHVISEENIALKRAQLETLLVPLL